MPSTSPSSGRLRRASITVAYRTETGVRDWLSRRAVRRGWTPAVIPYSGYASGGHARVLGRVVLAPASVDPSGRRDVRGWRRLLTLESPGAEVHVELAGSTTTVRSNEAGIIDARIDFDSPVDSSTADATLTVGARDAIVASIHVVSEKPVRGVVCDIDDTAWVTGISHPIRAAWRTLRGTSSTRKTVPGMGRLLQAAVEGDHLPGVVYLSNGPWNLVGPVTRFLGKNHFPAGAVLMTDWGITPDRWFRDGQKHKSSSLARLLDDFPHVTWVLVGDDGEHDPQLYRDLAESHPGRVAAIALRQTAPTLTPTKRGATEQESVNGVPVLHGPDGDALLPLLRAVL
ncbi:App1 family protein [Marisediminicola sp. LYQ85]|uniref:App1 family protein n=1 Tax=Marisediminicola sp. LYQ85 TaxID=3391062 RepID=UPI003983C6E7